MPAPGGTSLFCQPPLPSPTPWRRWTCWAPLPWAAPRSTPSPSRTAGWWATRSTLRRCWPPRTTWTSRCACWAAVSALGSGAPRRSQQARAPGPPAALQASLCPTCPLVLWQPTAAPVLAPADISDNQLLAAAGVAVGGATRAALTLAEGSSVRGNQAFLAGLLLGGGDGDLSVQLAASNDTDNAVVLVGGPPVHAHAHACCWVWRTMGAKGRRTADS